MGASASIIFSNYAELINNIIVDQFDMTGRWLNPLKVSAEYDH